MRGIHWGYLLLFLLVYACTKKNTEKAVGVPVCEINYSFMKKSDLKDFLRSRDCTYILLNDSAGRASFGRTDKVKIINGLIYILDGRLRTLAVYTINGDAVTTVGKRGQGPAEFVNTSDFDVDSLGNICILDGRTNKVLFYDSSFQFTSEKQLPFAADIVQFLDKGYMMYGLSSWNQGQNQGDKIIVTDKELNVIESFFKYDKYLDPAYWISGYQFAKLKHTIAYNQTINDDIYVFTDEGKLKEIIHFNFGDVTVPNGIKTNIEANLRDFDDYCLLKKIVAVTEQYIVGLMWIHRETKMFIVDRNAEICYLSNVIEDIDRNYLCGFSEQGFISNIVEVDENYPDSVNKHLKSEGSVLRITSINN